MTLSVVVPHVVSSGKETETSLLNMVMFQSVGTEFLPTLGNSPT